MRWWGCIVHLLNMLVIAIPFSLLLLSAKAQDKCTPPSGKPNCVCETTDGVIDLTSMSYQDGNPYFQWVYDTNNQAYSYNPCHEFNDGYSVCSYGDVAVCQNAYGDEEHSCGTSSSETMHVDDNGQYYLQYDEGDGDRISQVFLVCDSTANEPELTADGDGETTLTYIFHLKTKCACPGTCVDAPPPTDPDPPHKGGGGGGGGGGGIEGPIGIAVINLAIGGVATYFIVGAIILKFKFERTGTDIIPHKEFWFDLPFLIKDGCVFTFTPLVRLIKRDGYDKV